MMKFHFTSVGLALVVCTSSCNNEPERPADRKADSPVHVDGFYMDENEVGSGNYRAYHSKRCPSDTVYYRPETSGLARTIFDNKDWDKSDNEGIWFVDSLKSNDALSRSFYFRVVTNMQARLDGAFSEAFCMNGTEYVEKNTDQFLSYFDEAACFSENDLDTWASIVAGEYKILENSTEMRQAINKLYADLRRYREKSSRVHQERMERFIKMIEQKLW